MCPLSFCEGHWRLPPNPVMFKKISHPCVCSLVHICCTYIYTGFLYVFTFYMLSCRHIFLHVYTVHICIMYAFICVYLCIYIYILCRYPLAIKRVNGTMAHHLPVSLVSSDWVNSGSLMFSIISSY